MELNIDYSTDKRFRFDLNEEQLTEEIKNFFKVDNVVIQIYIYIAKVIFMNDMNDNSIPTLFISISVCFCLITI